ncbi:UNC-like C-terminal-domain-containing protein [Gilbertella persicaria]|uniref:UNC-like C-terminal-domain-containing protein n=1 Tax=Gilbertella persicaria TaxID=101096 RepID=UPI00221EEF74|nr:UNC-like C-terminal-domain-containing protein [Gilbertella persicaria]KAI8097936.1 UNC-like C-terminal-domain-containing protein [Gilbertella persicaria]
MLSPHSKEPPLCSRRDPRLRPNPKKRKTFVFDECCPTSSTYKEYSSDSAIDSCSDSSWEEQDIIESHHDSLGVNHCFLSFVHNTLRFLDTCIRNIIVFNYVDFFQRKLDQFISGIWHVYRSYLFPAIRYGHASIHQLTDLWREITERLTFRVRPRDLLLCLGLFSMYPFLSRSQTTLQSQGLASFDDRIKSISDKMFEREKWTMDIYKQVISLQQQVLDELINYKKDYQQIHTSLQEHEDDIKAIYQLFEQQVLDNIYSYLNTIVANQKDQAPFYQDKWFYDEYLKSELKDVLDQNKRLSSETMHQLITESPTKTMAEPASDLVIALTDILEKSIQSAITRYHQDVLNKPDFALYYRGGRILDEFTSRTMTPFPAWIKAFRFAIGLYGFRNQPEMALLPQTYPNQCWSMEGSQGTLGIKLSESIWIQSVTIEHPSNLVLLKEINKAPKDIEIMGIDYYEQELYSLSNVSYNIHGKSQIQTFKIDPKMLQGKAFNMILLRIHSNWGNSNQTDIYRVRVHGHPVHEK